jgi:membrane protease YdiL (CAAX protease family)
MIGLRFGVAAIGLTLLILEWSRRRAEKRGLVAPRPAPPAPPPLVSPPASAPLTTPETPADSYLAAAPPGAGATLLWPFLAIVAAFVLLPPLAMEAVSRAWPEGGDLDRMLVATGAPTFLAALLVCVRRARVLRDPGPPAAPLGVALREAARTFCVSGFVIVPVALAWTFLVRYMGLPDESQALVGKTVLGPAREAYLIAGFGVLVAPFTEECLYRAFLYPQARLVVRRAAAAAGTALFFAAAHMNWQAVAALFVIAWFLADLYERTRSILAVTLVHATFNASSLLPLLLLRSA